MNKTSQSLASKKLEEEISKSYATHYRKQHSESIKRGLAAAKARKKSF